MENESVFDAAPEQDAFTRIAEAVEGLVEIMQQVHNIGSGFAPIPIGSIPVEYVQKTKTFRYMNVTDVDNDINAWMGIVGATEIVSCTDVPDQERTMGRMRIVIVKAPKPLPFTTPPEKEIITEECDRV